MKKMLFLLATVLFSIAASAEDGHDLWLRYSEVNKAQVTANKQSPTIDIAKDEMKRYWQGAKVQLVVSENGPKDGAFSIKGNMNNVTIEAGTDIGVLYGAYDLLRTQGIGQKKQDLSKFSAPAFGIRILNHWDNLDGSIERGYAGNSIFWNAKTPDTRIITEYARANASLGINGTVLNNVNASPKMLTAEYLDTVKVYADILRPYGIKVYLSINFASPMALGETKTADPLDKDVAAWWKAKAKEIYALIPDFGGFLVKANSEGQPGPGDYKRSHADGANMLADALQPYGGIVMWRCFVYGANHKGEDRVKQAVSEFKPLDGKFRPNVILQTKNGPLDFQPREPYSPIFDQIKETPNMVELQITQEYLGQSLHLVYLATMWKEFFSFVSPESLVGIAGVSNIGDDRDWCGHHFSQANWYAFGRLAWNPQLSAEGIAEEWLCQTFSQNNQFVKEMTNVMMESREACVDYMMPLGLHHIFKFDHHYGPEPDGFKAQYPIEWCPVYYHKADAEGVGFDRSSKGTNAVAQYREPYCSLYDNLSTCPEEYLLWFHHVPWTYKMKSGRTLWQELNMHYNRGVEKVKEHRATWNMLWMHVDKQRYEEVSERLNHQVFNAQEWRDVCLKYFATFSGQRIEP